MEGALQQWYALINCHLHIPFPEAGTEEQLMVWISRLKWLFKKNFIYGVEMEIPTENFNWNEDDVIKKAEDEFV